MTQPADSAIDPRLAARRDSRFAAQQLLWSLSARDRAAGCGRHSTGGDIQLRVGHESGRRGGFGGVQTCGSVWACPVCSAKILARRQQEVIAAVTAAVVLGMRPAFFTYTVRHQASDPLPLVWDAIQAAHHAIFSGQAAQDDKDEYGVATGPLVVECDIRACGRVVECAAKNCGLDNALGRKHKAKCRAGQPTVAAVRHARVCRIGKPSSAVLPWLRVVEVTHGANGWHVHQHLLVFLPAGTTDIQRDVLYRDWFRRWADGAARAGLDGSLPVNVAKWVDSADAIGTYVTKNTYTPAELVALEMTRGDLKRGRFDNRSMMQLLGDVVATGNADDLDTFNEFERHSAGRRQMTWAHGARDLFNLDVEQDDEDIAAEEVGTAEDTIAVIDAEDFRWIADTGRRGELLAAAERSDKAAFYLLDAWGVRWRPPTQQGPAHRHLE